MAYATPDQLAAALNDPRLATTQPELLEACLEAAATEIDANVDRLAPPVDPPPAIVVRTNVNRAAEWFKATDAANGGVGFTQTGVLTSPGSGFERHAAALTPVTEQWGIG